MHSGVVGLHAGGNRGLTHHSGQVIKLLINISSHHLTCLIRRQVLACQHGQSVDTVETCTSMQEPSDGDGPLEEVSDISSACTRHPCIVKKLGRYWRH